MVCCVIVAAVFGFFISPLFLLSANPLAWRPSVADAESTFLKSILRKRLRSFQNAFNGWHFLVLNETNFQIQIGCAGLAFVAGIWCQLTITEWFWVIVCIAIVLFAEALNTAVERTCDAISRDFSPDIKIAKDVAAGAVLIAALAAGLAGASIFLPHILERLPGHKDFHAPALCQFPAS